MMAQIALWRNDMGGGATVGGTANAVTLTLNGTMAAYTQTLLSFVATAPNTGATTMKVDGTTALPLRITAGADMTGGELAAGRIYFFFKNPSAAEWLMSGSSISKTYVDAGDAAALAAAATAQSTASAAASAASAAQTTANSATTTANSANTAAATAQTTANNAAAVAAAAVPSQTGNASKVLKTNGTATSWSGLTVTANASVAAGGSVTFANNMSISGSTTSFWTVTLSGLANANYSISISQAFTGGSASIAGIASKTSTGFTINWVTYNAGGAAAPGTVVDITIVGGL
jgi:hypothetical protein